MSGRKATLSAFSNEQWQLPDVEQKTEKKQGEKQKDTRRVNNRVSDKDLLGISTIPHLTRIPWQILFEMVWMSFPGATRTSSMIKA